jgi:hypothetical protein
MAQQVKDSSHERTMKRVSDEFRFHTQDKMTLADTIVFAKIKP